MRTNFQTGNSYRFETRPFLPCVMAHQREAPTATTVILTRLTWLTYLDLNLQPWVYDYVNLIDPCTLAYFLSKFLLTEVQ
jgi:hypothetical protein